MASKTQFSETESRFLRFVPTEPTPVNYEPGAKIWTVQGRRTGESLGEINWYKPWKRYVFCPGAMTEFDANCLRDIADRCERETAKFKHS